MHDILFIASQSPARQQLLRYAHIPFKVINHQSDEVIKEPPQNFHEYVKQIAHQKMRSVDLPARHEIQSDHLFVMTADTLIKDPRTNEILAKPIDKQDALRMLALERQGPIEVATGICLERFIWQHTAWQTHDHRHWASSALVEFYVDEASVDRYLSNLPIAFMCSGAGVIEEHGLSYLKSINGSYTAALGLPIYEVRIFLKEMGFVKN